MKHATRALAIVVCAVSIGCTPSPIPPTSIATESPIVLHHTRDTALLVDIALSTDFESSYQSTLQFDTGTHQGFLDQLSNQTIQYFVSHHALSTRDSDLRAIPLVQDGLAILRHPDNPVDTLSRDNLQRIYRGFITNWQELGGVDEAITVYTRTSDTALSLEFNRLVMGNQVITPNAQVLTSTEQMLRRIADDPNGIAYIPISSIDDNMVTMAIDDIEPTILNIENNSYPLRMTVYAILQQASDARYNDVSVWIQNLSQEDLGGRFVPLAR